MKAQPAKSQNGKHCWFCSTDNNVNHTGQIMNPCPYSDNRYISILLCDRCNVNHKMHLKEYWDSKLNTV